MAAKRQRRSPEFKAKVALATFKGDKTMSQLSSDFGVSSIQISQRKRHLLQWFSEVSQQKGKPVDIDALIAPHTVYMISTVTAL